MIIQALYNYYDTLLADEDSKVSPPGFSKAKVSYAAVLSRNGELLDIIDLTETKGKKKIPRDIDVPEQVIRSGSGVKANFMCDNSTYVFGLKDKSKDEDKNIKAFKAFLELHELILQESTEYGAQAVLKFLQNWNVEDAINHPNIKDKIDELQKGGNIVFRLEGETGFIHGRQAVIDAWTSYNLANKTDVIAQCLVTGEKSPIARLHQFVKGVTGAQSSGASIVSFNQDAFTSYGKTQSYNAPVSQKAVFAYTTVINYLLRSKKHRMNIGDTTTVFWAERSAQGLEEDLLGALFFPELESSSKKDSEQKVTVRDPQTVQLLHDIFARIRAGLPVSAGLNDVDNNVNFYILGLSPNASRLSIRFWHADKFGKFLDKIGQHYIDLNIVKSFTNEPDFIPINMILKETAPLGKSENIPPLLSGVLMRSILTGMLYPQVLYNSVISRIRVDHEVNYPRAAIIKACLIRKWRYLKKGNEVEITMALNRKNTNTAYMLGRLFALLEKAQQDANPGINSTIKDRYFGSASAMPGSVFPVLLRLAQHHISKAEYGRNIDKQIEEVINGIDEFPSHLKIEDQGLFVIGYYQQRQALYAKNEKKEG